MSSSWLEIDPDSDFSMQNFPFGVFSVKEQGTRRCATRLGDTVIDLSVLEECGMFEFSNIFHQPTLNAFLEMSPSVWNAVRQQLVDLFRKKDDGGVSTLSDNPILQQAAFYSINQVHLHLPIAIGDYTDFYSSREHAENVGQMFRNSKELNPNWTSLPVAYHGRASTVFVSGREIVRPSGQLGADSFGKSQQLDFELEVATVLGGPPNPTPLSIDEAKERIFGFVLMNDWSARDLQRWEYFPLGPFTSKNFGTTISPWIIYKDALSSVAAVPQSTVPLPYLQDPNPVSYDIDLSVSIQTTTTTTAPTVVCQSNFKHLYWNPAQQVTHHSVSGCVLKAGDLLGSGTISAPDSFGSMLELSWNGTRPVSIGNGDETRTFLQDGDTVILKGVSVRDDGQRVGFGECVGTIVPSTTAAALQEESHERYRDFVLYSYYASSSSWRVRATLVAKSIEYKTIPINLREGENKTDAFLAKNPLGQVPLLEFTDTATGETIRLAQSLAIVKFLEDAFPNRQSVLPKNPLELAAATEIIEVINSGTQPLQNIFFLENMEELSEGKIQAKEVAKSVITKGLTTVETLVKLRRGNRGPYCMGTFSPTLVDICVVPQLHNGRRFGVDVDMVCPVLVETSALCDKHPWFQASRPSAQPDAPSDG